MADVIVNEQELMRFGTQCLMSAGSCEEHASKHIAVLIEADRRGHYSHGFNRLRGHYVADIRSKICSPNSIPSIEKETVSTAVVNGNNSLGAVVGHFAMDLAISKAKETGVGWVTVRGSNHFGIAGHYAKKALDEGMIGLAFTNGSPYVAPTRSATQLLSTLPIALAVPANNGDHMLLDMATSSAAVGKMELAKALGKPIPQGWALNKSGKPTTDPVEALPSGGGTGLPLGGEEETSGYKGYGLGLMVEIFCGILSGSDWGPHIRKWKIQNQIANLGQCFIALDPSVFTPGFQDRSQSLLDTCRGLVPLDPNLAVIIPGDRGRAREQKAEEEGGIRYKIEQYKNMLLLAEELNLEPPKPIHQ
ncbi:uncharacterized protein LOC111711452 [Eurytemora carolleeae]|uniref:uncharacterized protein LOC111711452 n=1 Tax=Eurytemora carolleeae TaxID=1294199 RepID=UPI000C78D907|nr:uncharacterized protein LOC111711452 [Eurytemora carolleeae]|eukprot:XP_023341588.1 uncharacterized protein LOC111711452 [Eurytemora affinis]